MIRLFVAFDLPAELRVRLTGLRGQVPGARWIPAESMHLTLRYIGEVNEDVAEDVHDALGRVADDPFEIQVSGVGHFESRGQVRALWAGVTRNEALARFQARIETVCQRAGLAPESRRFHPHVTLARCRDTSPARVAPFVAEHAGFQAPPFQVGSFVLYSSNLGRSGSSYIPEVTYPLGSYVSADQD
ncbi:MAG: RNA 2',3'-cyclic phosphodiesterase [Alphaproteobacteria bacterium]|nr:RNA 2',3'-cyclic phosphodiesterase [Alphaproteobacteria bacterium]